MFVAITSLFCITELFAAHYIFWGAPVDANLLSGLITACLWAASSGSQRDISVSWVIASWWGYCLATDKVIDNSVAVSMEASIMAVVVAWALFRPYFYTSAPMNRESVMIGFYNGTNAPILSSLSALVGLPFSSVAVIAGDVALRPSNGVLVPRTASSISHADYVLVDTGKPVTPEILDAIHKLEGVSTKARGLKIMCVSKLCPVFNLIGFAPKKPWQRLPSLFYHQCVRLSNG